MAQRAVVHDVIEGDGAVVPRLQTTLALVGGDAVVNGGDQVQLLGACVVWRRRAIEQEVELRRDVAGPHGNGHVAHRPVGPVHQIMRQGEGTTGFELRRKRPEIAGFTGAIFGERSAERLGRTGDRGGEGVQTRLCCGHVAEHPLQQRAGRLHAEVSALQQNVVRFRTNGVARLHIVR